MDRHSGAGIGAIDHRIVGIGNVGGGDLPVALVGAEVEHQFRAEVLVDADGAQVGAVGLRDIRLEKPQSRAIVGLEKQAPADGNEVDRTRRATGVDVGDADGAGGSSVGPPQLAAGDAVVRGEVERTVDIDQIGRIRAGTARRDVPDKLCGVDLASTTQSAECRSSRSPSHTFQKAGRLWK